MKIEGFPIANSGEKQIGIRSCYHLHIDPDLGANKAAVRRIPCSCKKCSKQKKLSWKSGVDAIKQPRFARNTECKYAPIFGPYNDWMIITTTPKNQSDIKNIDDIRRDILFGVTERIAHEIKIGSIGVYMTGDEKSTEYELVKFKSYAYTRQNSDNIEKIIKW